MVSRKFPPLLPLTAIRPPIGLPRLAATGLLATLIVLSARSLSGAVTLLSAPTPLSVLISDWDTGISAGDKYFTKFSYSKVGGMPPAAAIHVTPILDDQGNYGIRLQGDFGALPGEEFANALLRYGLVTADPRFVQKGAVLSGSMSVGPNGFGSVDQSFLGLNQFLGIYASTLGPTPVSKLLDAATFDRYHSTLTVTSDVYALSGPSDAARILVIDQTYARQMLGDYNHDEIVDGNDFLVWQREFGATAQSLNADGNRDGVVNADDLAVWRNQFGLAAPPSTSASAIPEPLTAALIAPVLAVTLHHRRQRRVLQNEDDHRP